jgi:hypothetical protein
MDTASDMAYWGMLGGMLTRYWRRGDSERRIHIEETERLLVYLHGRLTAA